MRLAFALVFLASVGPALADDLKPSQAACDVKKIGARELAECLRTTADKADRELAGQIEAADKVIDAKQGLLSTQKARWRHSLADAETAWLTWRDSECQDVAPFEAGIGAKGAGDPRLACIIDQDTRRIGDLKARYP
jgi:uncharacterized protein YecT (DUF1311 family)